MEKDGEKIELSYALILWGFGWEIYSLTIESVIFSSGPLTFFCLADAEDESVGILFDVEVLINWFERFSIRVEFVVVFDVNWERWDPAADGFDVCDIWLELGDGEDILINCCDWSLEIVEEMVDGFRDDEALWLRLLGISFEIRDLGGTDIDWFDNGSYVLDVVTFGSFLKVVDGVSVCCLLVKDVSLFSTVDRVIIEFDSIGVRSWDSSFCDRRWDVLDDIVDVFDCS